MKEIILSIRPEWTKLIFNGQKTIEMRRNMPDKISKVLIYETAPTKKIVGEFEVVFQNIRSGIRIAKSELKDRICLNESQIKGLEFWDQKKEYNLLHIGKVIKYKNPLEIAEFGKKPPQNFCYLKGKEDNGKPKNKRIDKN